MDEKYSYYKTASMDRYDLLRGSAVEMRKNPTLAEAKMWQYIRNKQLGVKFRRQHPIGDYITDFIDMKSKLVIEIDGSIHNTLEQQIHDNERTRFLTDKGYTVIRFTNSEILRNIDEVIFKIKSVLSSLFSYNNENLSNK